MCSRTNQAIGLSCIGVFPRKKILGVLSRTVISFKFVSEVFQREAEITGIRSHCVDHPRYVGLVCSSANNIQRIADACSFWGARSSPSLGGPSVEVWRRNGLNFFPIPVTFAAEL